MSRSIWFHVERTYDSLPFNAKPNTMTLSENSATKMKLTAKSKTRSTACF